MSLGVALCDNIVDDVAEKNVLRQKRVIGKTPARNGYWTSTR